MTLLEQGFNLFNVRFVTLAQIARDLNPPSRAGLTPLPAGGLAALSHFEFEHITGADPFNGVWRYPGFARSLSRSFSDLAEACIEHIFPEWLIEPTRRTTLDQRRIALKDLYSKFRERSAGFITPERLYAPPVQPLKALQMAYGAGELIVYGVYDVNEAEWRLLKQILKYIPTDYFFPFLNSKENPSPSYSFAQRLLERLKSEIGANVEPISNARRPSQTVFALKPEEGWSGAELSVFQTANPAKEAEIVAGQIAELVFFERVDPAKIGVVLWDAQLYRPLVVEALKLTQIPVADRIGKAVTETALGKAALSLLSFSPVSIRRRELFDLLSLGIIRLGEETDEPSAYDLERVGIESGIIQGGVDVWRNSLLRLEERSSNRDTVGDKRRARVASLVKAFIADLFAKLTEFDRTVGFVAQAEAATNILSQFLPSSSERESLVKAITGLGGLDRSGVLLSRLQFSAVVRDTLQAVKVDTTVDPNGIEVLTPLMSRGLGFDYLFIPGLVQGAVPASSREDPFLPNELRQRINRRISGQPHHPLVVRGLRIEEERLLFALALDSAKKALVLSYPVNALGGSRTHIPSRFLLEACKLKRGGEVDAESIKELDFFKDLTQENKYPGWERRLLRPSDYPMEYAKRYLALRQLPGLWKTLPKEDSIWFNRLTKLNTARSIGSEFTRYDGVFDSSKIKAPSEPSKFSVTALEEWAQCPFRYFLSHRLGLEEWKEPEISIQPPPSLTGTVIHEALQKVYEKALQEGKLPLQDESSEWAKVLVDESLITRRRKMRHEWPAPETAYAVAEEVWKRRILATLKNLAEFDVGWAVDSFEKNIELELHMTDEGGKDARSLVLAGRIDRRDISPAGLIRIVDYKTGKANDPLKFSDGSSLQLPIYLKAALEGRSEKDWAESLAVYVKIGNHGNLTLRGIDGNWLREYWTEITLIVGVISEGIEQGIYPPLPIKADQCKSCRVKSACDIRSRTSAVAKMEDFRTAKLQMLRSEH